MYDVVLTIDGQQVTILRVADQSAYLVASQALMTAQHAVSSGSYGQAPTIDVRLMPSSERE